MNLGVSSVLHATEQAVQEGSASFSQIARFLRAEQVGCTKHLGSQFHIEYTYIGFLNESPCVVHIDICSGEVVHTKCSRGFLAISFNGVRFYFSCLYEQFMKFMSFIS